MKRFAVGMLVLGAAWASVAHAAQPRCEVRTPMQRGLEYESVEVRPDRTILFRLCAPQAQGARVVSGDMAPAIPPGFDGKPSGLTMARDADDYWTATTPTPLAPGTYSFAFEIGGATMPDPQGTIFGRKDRGVHSIVEVPGPSADFFAYDPAVPHGRVSTVEYRSPSLGMMRRAQVYTPPGYEGRDAKNYPVLYLVHGATDSDDSWVAKGHAPYILDNLIAAGKAQPMIVVMPFGHTPARDGVARMENTDFGADFTTTLIPYIDRHYRTIPNAGHRAMAGLSMGGAHTLQFGLPRPDLFGSVGIFSIGLLDDDQMARYIATNDARLKQRARAKSFVYFAMGRDDFIYKRVAPTLAVMDRYGIRYQYHETGGGHDWPNWRDYLRDFVPLLFR